MPYHPSILINLPLFICLFINLSLWNMLELIPLR